MTRVAMALLLAVGAVACSGGTPTAPTSTLTPQTELFSGTLAAGGFRFYSFNVTDTSHVTAMLASVSAGGPALDTPLGLAFGRPAGTDCATAEATVTASSLTAQLSAVKTAGIHCVRVYDTGALTGTVNFAIRIVQF
jgi:hypothetical protein